MGKFPHEKDKHCKGLPSVVEPSLEVFRGRLDLWSWIEASPRMKCHRNEGNQGSSFPKPLGFYLLTNCSISGQSCCGFKWELLKYEQKRPRLFSVVGVYCHLFMALPLFYNERHK